MIFDAIAVSESAASIVRFAGVPVPTCSERVPAIPRAAVLDACEAE